MKYIEFNIPDSLTGSDYLAIMTDRIISGKYQGGLRFESWDGPVQDMEQNLLELRIFNEQEEFKAYRAYKGIDFKCRYINDGTETRPFFDEIHYLDQDSNQTKEIADGYTRFATTGGGEYILPGNKKTRKAKVRTYLEETEETNGIQIPGDWRILGFVNDAYTGEEAE